MNPTIEVRNLRTHFFTRAGVVKAVDDVSFSVASGQVLGPVLSAFWHDEEFGEGEEWQVCLKTEADQYPHLEAHLRVNHPWDNPEITAYAIADGSAAYLDWISRTVS